MTTIRTFTPGPQSSFKADIYIATTDGKHTITDGAGRTWDLDTAGLERVERYMIETTEEVAA